jgi:hypothetical protein
VCPFFTTPPENTEMRALLPALLSLALAAPAVAQGNDPDNAVAGGGQFPSGWQARVDRDQPADEVVFRAMGTGYHATMGPAAVFYYEDWKEKGDYEVSASFTQTKAPAHPEAYGIIIGGEDLDEPDQEYSYFLVRGTGQYFIARRDGAERNVLVNWTDSDAVHKQDASTGKATNVLGARVVGDEVIFTVNGTEVARRPASEIDPDGIFGFRVNHNLDVHIDAVKK